MSKRNGKYLKRQYWGQHLFHDPKRLARNEKYSVYIFDRISKKKKNKENDIKKAEELSKPKESKLSRLKESLWITIAYYTAIMCNKLMNWIRYGKQK